MRKQPLQIFVFAIASLLFGSVSAFADTYTFSLLPAGGDITGLPGSVVGWGYEISNNSATYWLDPLAINAGLFQHGALDSVDYFTFPLVAPNTSVTEAFSAASSTGLAAIKWDANAPLGFNNSGNFDLSACFATSTGTCVQAAPDAIAAYSATVSETPEPSAMAMQLLGTLLFSAVAFKTLCRHKNNS